MCIESTCIESGQTQWVCGYYAIIWMKAGTPRLLLLVQELITDKINLTECQHAKEGEQCCGIFRVVLDLTLCPHSQPIVNQYLRPIN